MEMIPEAVILEVDIPDLDIPEMVMDPTRGGGILLEVISLFCQKSMAT